MLKCKEKKQFIHASEQVLLGEAALVSKYAAKWKCSEDQAASEIRELYASDQEHQQELDDAGVSRARHIQLGFHLMAEMMKSGAEGPAAQVWRTLGGYMGMDKPVQVQVEVSAPSAELVRARIAELMQKGSIRRQAELVNADLPALAAAAGHEVPAEVIEDAEIVEDVPCAPQPQPLHQYKPQLLPVEPKPLPEPAREVIPVVPIEPQQAPNVTAFAEKLDLARQKAASLK